MAENTTEKPTEKRLGEARKKGDVHKNTDLTQFSSSPLLRFWLWAELLLSIYGNNGGRCVPPEKPRTAFGFSTGTQEPSVPGQVPDRVCLLRA